jgi:hypothetical protein
MPRNEGRFLKGVRTMLAGLALAGLIHCGGGGGGGEAVVVDPGPTAPDPSEGLGIQVTLEKAYLTQSVQDGNLSLVAGRDAACRVFLRATQSNLLRPAVQVVLKGADGAVLLDKEVPSTLDGIPLAVDESAPGGWTLPVPGALIQPGLTLSVGLVPGSGIPGTPPPARSQAVPVVRMPRLRIQLVPILARSVPGGALRGPNIDEAGRTLQDWTRMVRDIYPVPGVDVRIGPSFTTGVALGNGTTMLDFYSVVQQLELTRKLRVQSGLVDPSEFVMGIYPAMPVTGMPLGMAVAIATPGAGLGRTALVWDGVLGQQSFADTLAHELGHLLGRLHAPCGGALVPDPDYAPVPAELGAPAFNVARLAPLPGVIFKDIMGYCYPRWGGIYTTRALMAALLTDQGAARMEALAQDCLLVAGSGVAGTFRLEPALEWMGPPSVVPAGDWSLRFRDASGNLLQEVSFQPAEVPDAEDIQAFQFAVPFPAALRDSLDSIEVVRAGTALARMASAGRLQAAREPVAQVWTGGKVRVGFDPGVHRLALVMDPRDGKVLARASGGEAEFATDAKEVDVLLSDGIRTTRRRLPVRP